MGAFGLIWLIRIFMLPCHHDAELVSAAVLLCIVLFQEWLDGSVLECYQLFCSPVEQRGFALTPLPTAVEQI